MEGFSKSSNLEKIGGKRAIIIGGLHTSPGDYNYIKQDLENKGYQVIVIDYNTSAFNQNSFDEIRQQMDYYRGWDADLVIGHSQGGRFLMDYADGFDFETELVALAPVGKANNLRVNTISNTGDIYDGSVPHDRDYRGSGNHTSRSLYNSYLAQQDGRDYYSEEQEYYKKLQEWNNSGQIGSPPQHPRQSDYWNSKLDYETNYQGKAESRYDLDEFGGKRPVSSDLTDQSGKNYENRYGGQAEYYYELDEFGGKKSTGKTPTSQIEQEYQGMAEQYYELDEFGGMKPK